MFAQKTKCRFGWHDWSVWQIVAHYVAKHGGSVEKIHQSRTCQCCGFKQYTVTVNW